MEGGKAKLQHPLLYLMIGVMVLLWAANFIVAKIVLREFPPLVAAGLRVALAGVLMLPVYVWQSLRSKRECWTTKDVLVLAFLGVCGVAGNQIFFILGMSRTSVAHSAFIIAMTPISVLLIAALLKQEHLTARKLTGMAIAIFGVVMLNTVPVARGSQPSLFGDVLIFLAGLTFALFTVFGKQVVGRHSSITVNTFGYVGGGLVLAPLTWWHARGLSWPQISTTGWACIVYMALFPSVICYLIYYYALSHIPASRLAAFSYLQPALATLMAVTLLGERVTLPLIAGGAVIFSGVYLTERA